MLSARMEMLQNTLSFSLVIFMSTLPGSEFHIFSTNKHISILSNLNIIYSHFI